MMELQWEDPPPDKRWGNRSRRSLEIDKILLELQANPGRWALVKRDTSRSAMATWKRRGCETLTRSVDGSPGKHDVYARWPEKENHDG